MDIIRDCDLAVEIAGYARISVDTELDKDNTSIENQIDFIKDYVSTHFPKCNLTIYSDRDKSGYTFEQREDYQRMRKRLMSGEVKILIIKDFSRFSRRNSLGLYELELLRDAGVRIISITDAIDFPKGDEWLQIQLKFLLNEQPVTDASKKVRAVIKKSQGKGEWLCAVPYGYVVTNHKKLAFEIVPDEAEVIREVFRLYGEGWGYKRIANYLTDQNIPTPRMKERERAEAAGNDYRRSVKKEWSIVTISGILENDFYIGTLRQHKYQRTKINGSDAKLAEDEHIVFEKHHPAIIDDRTFFYTQEQLKQRSTSNYRGIKKYDTAYSGYLFCGDCNSPMFSMSRADLAPAYTCGTYHKRGLKGCTSHHTRVDFLDGVLKDYIRLVRANCTGMIEKLEQSIATEADAVKENENIIDILQDKLETAKEELKAAKKRKIKDILKRPDDEALIEETYAEIEQELTERIYGLENQIKSNSDKRNAIIEVNRAAKTVFEVFDNILNKEKLDKIDISLIVDRITVYDSNTIEVKLKADITHLLEYGTLPGEEIAANFKCDSIDNSTKSAQYSLSASRRKTKVYTVNVISEGDPLEIFTDRDGEVIFKKYSPMGEMGAVAGELAEALARTAGMSCAICDRDAVIAAAGGAKKDILEKRISAELEQLMEQRVVYERGVDDSPELTVSDNDEYNVVVAVPIITEGDVSGCVVYVSEDDGASANEVTVKLCQTAAQFMAKRVAV